MAPFVFVRPVRRSMHVKNKQLLFVYNEKSGKGVIRNYLADVIGLFTRNGYDVLTHPTQARGDAEHFVQEHAGDADAVVCSGGDGTLDEVVNAVMNVKPHLPVGYIPSGSTNDFATSLSLPKNPVEAARDIMVGDIYRCDVGAFNGTYFVYVAAFGLFTDVSYQTDQNLKNSLGYLAYILEAGKRLMNIPVFHLRVEVEGQVLEGNYCYGMITNSRSVGGMKNITGNDIDMNDGLFEVTLVHTPVTPLDMNEIATSILTGDYHSSLVENFKAAAVTIEATGDIDWTLDGEYGGKHRVAAVVNCHKALRLYLNRRKSVPLVENQAPLKALAKTFE